MLLAVPFDLSQLEVTGGPVEVVEGILSDPITLALSLSDNGTLAYVPEGSQTGRNLVWVDRKGNAESLGAPQRLYRNPRLSPDGQRLALTIGPVPYGVWVWDVSRQTLTKLTFEYGFGRLDD